MWRSVEQFNLLKLDQSIDFSLKSLLPILEETLQFSKRDTKETRFVSLQKRDLKETYDQGKKRDKIFKRPPLFSFKKTLKGPVF